MAHILSPAIPLVCIATACSAAPAAAPVASGRFEQLSVAVAPDGGVTGAYREVQGEGVTKSCAFTLDGRIGQGNVATVQVRSAGRQAPLTGRIVLRRDEVVLTVPGARDLPGCGLVLMPEIDSGIALSRTATTRWTAMRRIGVAKAPLYAAPGGGATRGYLVAGDVVGVSAGAENRRSAVDYFAPDGRVMRGWVAAGALAPLMRMP